MWHPRLKANCSNFQLRHSSGSLTTSAINIVDLKITDRSLRPPIFIRSRAKMSPAEFVVGPLAKTMAI